jgi:hypothetical protein
VIVCGVLLVWDVLVTSALVAGNPFGVADVGSLAEWATAGVTLLALVAAGWAGVSASGQLEVMRRDAELHEREARSRDVEARERQARLVFPMHQRVPTEDGLRHVVVVDNRSEQPITHVVVLVVGPTLTNGFHVGTVAPGTSTVGGAGARIAAAIEEILGGREEFRQLAESVEFELPMVFTDRQGVRWHLLPGGELIERDASFGITEAQQHSLETSRFYD